MDLPGFTPPPMDGDGVENVDSDLESETDEFGVEDALTMWQL